MEKALASARVFPLCKALYVQEMKLLNQYQDINEAERVANKLETKGILSFVSSKRSYNLSSYKTGALKVGVWIVLNNQYSDAVSFLKNKNHKIQSAISPEEIKTLKEQAQKSTFHSLNKFIAYAFIFIVLFCGVMYLLFKNSNSI